MSSFGAYLVRKSQEKVVTTLLLMAPWTKMARIGIARGVSGHGRLMTNKSPRPDCLLLIQQMALQKLLQTKKKTKMSAISRTGTFRSCNKYIDTVTVLLTEVHITAPDGAEKHLSGS